MNILYVYADHQGEWNCSEWRCAVPNRAINTLGTKHKSDMLFAQQFASFDEEAKTKVRDADLIIVQRLLIAEVLPRIMEAQANGKVVVAEVDDGYHYMPKILRAYPFWHEGVFTMRDEQGQEKSGKMKVPPVEQLEWGIKICHGLTTPSPQIAKDWQKFIDNTWVVHNYIDASHYLPYKKKKWERTETFVIGWGGSHSHVESWQKSNIVGALKNICDKYLLINTNCNESKYQNGRAILERILNEAKAYKRALSSSEEEFNIALCCLGLENMGNESS